MTKFNPQVLMILGGAMLVSAAIMFALGCVLRQDQTVLIVMIAAGVFDAILGLLLLLLGFRRMGSGQ